VERLMHIIFITIELRKTETYVKRLCWGRKAHMPYVYEYVHTRRVCVCVFLPPQKQLGSVCGGSLPYQTSPADASHKKEPHTHHSGSLWTLDVEVSYCPSSTGTIPSPSRARSEVSGLAKAIKDTIPILYIEQQSAHHATQQRSRHGN
jgi:hypothetical protein